MNVDGCDDMGNLERTSGERAKAYDEWYLTFEGAVENYIDWQLLTPYLPVDHNARILDAAGGTGRITLPLAKIGYSVTLCDISPDMLNVAKQKLRESGLTDKVGLSLCDVRRLRFEDETFDFVLCWNGMIEDISELVRVTKRGGRLSIFFLNLWGEAVRSFRRNPLDSLASLRSKPTGRRRKMGEFLGVDRDTARCLLEMLAVRVIDIYSVCGWMDVLEVPRELRSSRKWDESAFTEATEMVMLLSKEPSVSGMSRHLVAYGVKL